MGITNGWVFTKTYFDAPKFLAATGNAYRVVSARPFNDKHAKLPDGLTLTLTILEDNYDYGADKKTGLKRENNVCQNFDVTVLDRSCTPQRGDIVQLVDFDAENSFVIKFDYILRFHGVKILQSAQAQNGENHA